MSGEVKLFEGNTIPSESDKKVYIVRVIYGGRNIEEELNK